MWAGLSQSVQQLPTDWLVRESNPDVTGPGAQIGLLYNEYRIPLPGVKWPGRGVNYPPQSSAEVKEEVELYLYTPLCHHSRL